MLYAAFSCRSACVSYKLQAKQGADGPGQANRGGGNTEMPMNKLCLAFVALVAASGTGMAASAVNLDGEPRTLLVTDGTGTQTELAIGAGETVEFCASGCFVTLPNGDREALNGTETIEISGGVGKVK